MAYDARKTEHTGSKKGTGAFYGAKRIAKHGSNRRRRRDGQHAVEQALANGDAPPRPDRAS